MSNSIHFGQVEPNEYERIVSPGKIKNSRLRPVLSSSHHSINSVCSVARMHSLLIFSAHKQQSDKQHRSVVITSNQQVAIGKHAVLKIDDYQI